VLLFPLVALLGYWLAGTAVPERDERRDPAATPLARDPGAELAPRMRRAVRPVALAGDVEARELGALEGQRVLVFKNAAAMEEFLARVGKGVRVLDRIDALGALRVGFEDLADLRALLDGGEELSFVFPVVIPPLPEGGVQAGALPLGSQLAEWLGIAMDNSGWGAGVRVAVLDTGVAAHPAFQSTVRALDLVGMSGDPAALNGHGTAVASLIIGNGSLTPGVAPGAEILSVRVADDSGRSDSFLLARGIMAAVDAGASLINISMGGSGRSAVLEQAVAHALERGVLIFAAAGNNGSGQIHYPAAYDGVIAVGSVDARGNHLEFSNNGRALDVSAPGYAINAAWPGDKVAAVSGTSFSTPIVVGTVAAVMSGAGTGKLTAAQAWRMVASHLNDGGEAGVDPYLGAGMPDIGRVLRSGVPGVYDAAVASQRLLAPDALNPYGQMEILVQNRGTETLVNTTVRVASGGNRTTGNITRLAPNASTTIRVPVGRSLAEGSGIKLDSQVFLSGGLSDAKPSNDRRVEILGSSSR
jgi:hypothetical protein